MPLFGSSSCSTMSHRTTETTLILPDRQGRNKLLRQGLSTLVEMFVWRTQNCTLRQQVTSPNVRGCSLRETRRRGCLCCWKVDVYEAGTTVLRTGRPVIRDPS